MKTVKEVLVLSVAIAIILIGLHLGGANFS